ncbi:hypothetical protein [Nonomuraea pusilla]|uniref:hypothetical protein n=1 Tax=Nonomuraea pusilla TaxID=46177 RepID=UPI0011606661|nr:hypothetical protein [Nonomuraea pusilla]
MSGEAVAAEGVRRGCSGGWWAIWRRRARAAREKAEEPAGGVSGAVLPFAHHPDLELVVDPGLLRVLEIFFDAARLERPLAVVTDDYVRAVSPRVAPIAVAS